MPRASGADSLPVLEAVIEHVSSTAVDGASELSYLLQEVKASADAESARAAVESGSVESMDIGTCCRAVRTLCTTSQPPLLPKNQMTKLKKAVQQAHASNNSVPVASLLLLPGGKGASAERSARAAECVAKLLALLTRVGLRAQKNPLDIAKIWAPALGLDNTTIQLLLIRSTGAAERQTSRQASRQASRQSAANPPPGAMLPANGATPDPSKQLHFADDESEQPFEVTLERDQGEGFGLGIGESADGGAPVLTEIAPGSAADRNGVMPRPLCLDTPMPPRYHDPLSPAPPLAAHRLPSSP